MHYPRRYLYPKNISSLSKFVMRKRFRAVVWLPNILTTTTSTNSIRLTLASCCIRYFDYNWHVRVLCHNTSKFYNQTDKMFVVIYKFRLSCLVNCCTDALLAPAAEFMTSFLYQPEVDSMVAKTGIGRQSIL